MAEGGCDEPKPGCSKSLSPAKRTSLTVSANPEKIRIVDIADKEDDWVAQMNLKRGKQDERVCQYCRRCFYRDRRRWELHRHRHTRQDYFVCTTRTCRQIFHEIDHCLIHEVLHHHNDWPYLLDDGFIKVAKRECRHYAAAANDVNRKYHLNEDIEIGDDYYYYDYHDDSPSSSTLPYQGVEPKSRTDCYELQKKHYMNRNLESFNKECNAILKERKCEEGKTKRHERAAKKLLAEWDEWDRKRKIRLQEKRKALKEHEERKLLRAKAKEMKEKNREESKSTTGTTHTKSDSKQAKQSSESESKKKVTFSLPNDEKRTKSKDDRKNKKRKSASSVGTKSKKNGENSKSPSKPEDEASTSTKKNKTRSPPKKILRCEDLFPLRC